MAAFTFTSSYSTDDGPENMFFRTVGKSGVLCPHRDCNPFYVKIGRPYTIFRGRSFRSKKDMNKHFQDSHGNDPTLTGRCQHCGAWFNPGDLYQHNCRIPPGEGPPGPERKSPGKMGEGRKRREKKKKRELKALMAAKEKFRAKEMGSGHWGGGSDGYDDDELVTVQELGSRRKEKKEEKKKEEKKKKEAKGYQNRSGGR